MSAAAYLDVADQAAAWSVRRGLWRDYDEAQGEARLILCEVFPTWDGRGTLPAYLAVRIRQRLVDRWRKGEMGDRRRAGVPEVWAPDTLPHAVSASAESVVLDHLDAETWAATLAALPPDLTEVLRAALQPGGQDDLARQRGVTPSSVSGRKRTAVRRSQAAVS